ncbi:MAG: hypothetical protein K0S54_1070 [Alphaproteobacteria bacterium]|nr:hypothetical protein [Alphaproteobacteria bacterium]
MLRANALELISATGGPVAGKQGFSGVGPPDRGQSPRAAANRDRLVRMAPPANDNRGQGVSLGRLSFTGLRVLFVAGSIAVLALLAAAAGLV